MFPFDFDQNEGSGENAFADMIGGLVGALINQPAQFIHQQQQQQSGTPAGSSRPSGKHDSER